VELGVEVDVDEEVVLEVVEVVEIELEEVEDVVDDSALEVLSVDVLGVGKRSVRKPNCLAWSNFKS
jgi:hypothetical protein